jgi:hypothetical protein
MSDIERSEIVVAGVSPAISYIADRSSLEAKKIVTDVANL